VREDLSLFSGLAETGKKHDRFCPLFSLDLCGGLEERSWSSGAEVRVFCSARSLRSARYLPSAGVSSACGRERDTDATGHERPKRTGQDTIVLKGDRDTDRDRDRDRGPTDTLQALLLTIHGIQCSRVQSPTWGCGWGCWRSHCAWPARLHERQWWRR
jgi:hypothetical protein